MSKSAEGEKMSEFLRGLVEILPSLRFFLSEHGLVVRSDFGYGVGAEEEKEEATKINVCIYTGRYSCDG